LEHGRDELAEQRRKKELTPKGRELLEEVERMADSSEPPSEEILARVNALPPSDQAELVSILGGTVARGEERHRRKEDLARSAAETIREAEEQELAAGRPANPHMTLGEALEILGR
jgi:DNA-binding PadR family transcriptional regulator